MAEPSIKSLLHADPEAAVFVGLRFVIVPLPSHNYSLRFAGIGGDDGATYEQFPEPKEDASSLWQHRHDQPKLSWVVVFIE